MRLYRIHLLSLDSRLRNRGSSSCSCCARGDCPSIFNQVTGELWDVGASLKIKQIVVTEEDGHMLYCGLMVNMECLVSPGEIVFHTPDAIFFGISLQSISHVREVLCYITIYIYIYVCVCVQGFSILSFYVL